MDQVKGGTAEIVEESYKKSEENPKEFKLTAEESTSNSDTIRSVLLMLKETKQAASETFENTFKKLGEFTEGIKAPERFLKDTTTNTTKLDEDDVHFFLGMLERAKEIATDNSGETFKRIEANLYSQLSGESIETDAKLTEDDICFAKQMLEKTKENAKRYLQYTFKNLEEKIVKVAKSFQTSTESSTESKPLRKFASFTTQPDATLQQRKQEVNDTAKNICKKGKEVDVETENSEKLFSHDKSPEETIQTESDAVAIVQGDFQATEICESNEKKKVTATEKGFSERKEIGSNVSKAFQEDIDKLQTNLKKIFASVQDKTELLPETRTILKQVESKVIEMLEETKNRWKIDI